MPPMPPPPPMPMLLADASTQAIRSAWSFVILVEAYGWIEWGVTRVLDTKLRAVNAEETRIVARSPYAHLILRAADHGTDSQRSA